MRFEFAESAEDKFHYNPNNNQAKSLTNTLNKVGGPQRLAKGIEVFTTRPDTLFGASFIALSPDHPLTKKLEEDNSKITEFRADCAKIGTTEEAIATAPKLGFDTGLRVEHPFDETKTLPVWIANFVLMGYGTGAIFGCPAHDQRDLDLARKYGCLLYTSPSPRDATLSRMPSSA